RYLLTILSETSNSIHNSLFLYFFVSEIIVSQRKYKVKRYQPESRIISRYLAVFSQNQVHFGRKKLSPGEKLVGVSRPVILPPGFLVMTCFTQWLPIAPIPEQLLVTTVRNNVMHNRCFGIASLLPAFRTQRVALKERFA